MTEVIQLIETLGFPIAVCFIVMYYCMKLTESHKDETDKFTEAITNNTLAITELKAMISTLLTELRKDTADES